MSSGERGAEEACAGKLQAGFWEGEASNSAGSHSVTLPGLKGGSNREYKADLPTGADLPTRQRLEHGRFHFPHAAAKQELSLQGFQLLLDGIALGGRH
jgi:hypothetical protein